MCQDSGRTPRILTLSATKLFFEKATRGTGAECSGVYTWGMQHTTAIETNEIHGYLERALIARGVDADRLATAMHAEGWRYDWRRDGLDKR